MADDAPAESLQVSAELEAEFEQALQYHLTDEDIERARAPARRRHRRAGTASSTRSRPPTPSATGRSASATTTRSTPTRSYGPTTRWGTQIGHGTMMGHVKTPDARRPDPRRDQEADQEPVPRRARVRVRRHVGLVPAAAPRRPHLLVPGEESLDVKKSEFAGRSVDPGAAATSRSTSSARCSASTGSCACSPSARSRATTRQVRRDRAGALHRRRLRADRRDLRVGAAARRREALLGGRQRRRRAAADGEGPARPSPR